MKKLILAIIMGALALSCKQPDQITNNYYTGDSSPTENSWFFSEVPAEAKAILDAIEPFRIQSPNGSGTDYLSQTWNKQNDDWDVTRSFYYYLSEIPNLDFRKFGVWNENSTVDDGKQIQVQLMGPLKAKRFTRLFVSVRDGSQYKSYNLYL
jgi:hypothetical protein